MVHVRVLQQARCGHVKRVYLQVVHPSRDVDLARTLLLDCLRDLICRLRAWKVRCHCRCRKPSRHSPAECGTASMSVSTVEMMTAHSSYSMAHA